MLQFYTIKSFEQLQIPTYQSNVSFAQNVQHTHTSVVRNGRNAKCMSFSAETLKEFQFIYTRKLYTELLIK